MRFLQNAVALAFLSVVAGAVLPANSLAQSAEPGRLIVSVRDPTGAVIVNARVTVRPDDRPETFEGATGTEGTATFEGVGAGRYTVTASFAGFQTGVIRDVRVRSGITRRSLTLAIDRRAEDVTVGRDRQERALDPRGDAFSTILTREQIDALPDDPTELEAVLKAMSPPGATIRVDGFTGGRLPPKSQIRSIRLPRIDQFAAEAHGGMNGALNIDIMTQPGGASFGGSVETSLRDDALNARNPFTPNKGEENLRQGNIALSGPIVSGKSSFGVDVGRGRQLDELALLAALPDGNETAALNTTSTNATFGTRFDQALGASHAIRASVRGVRITQNNLGVGGYDLPERAYRSTSREFTARASENGPIGRRLFIDSRLEAQWRSSRVDAATERPTIRVLDAFTAGGAQRAGGRQSFRLEAATDVDYVRGAHSLRAGILTESHRFRSDERTNYLGTFTFSSLADYQAARPSLFQRRTGDPSIGYSNVQIGAYVQDDFRVARSVLLSFGARYEGQSLTRQWFQILPRATLSWSPFASGKSTVRGGWGSFRDWISASTFEQAMRVDGERQREVIINEPAFPEPGDTAAELGATRYVLDPDTPLARTTTWYIGLDQTIVGPLRLTMNYSERRSAGILRGLDENPLRNGIRIDPRFREVVRATADAEQRGRSLNVNLSVVRPEWRRLFLGFNYSLSSVRSNTGGPFVLPASGSIHSEWGVVQPRHRMGMNVSLRPSSSLSAGVNVRFQSGMPYTITTGTDVNGDGQFTDRPAGVSPGSARTASHWEVGGRLSYAIGIGGPAARSGGGGDAIVIRTGGPGGLAGGFDGGAERSRYRLEFYVAGQNLTNHANYIGYSGVMTSPFFGVPTNVLNPRKAEIGIRFGF
jgi:hypothetical protein